MDTQIKDSINIRETSRVSFLDVNDRKFGALELFVNGELSQVIIAQLAQPGQEIPPVIQAADEAVLREKYRKEGYRGRITFDTSAFYEIVG